MKRAAFSRFIVVVLATALLVPLLCGCETLGQQRARERMREREDYLVMEEGTRRLDARVESLEYEIARLDQELARVRAETVNTVQSQVRVLDGRVGDVEKSVHTLDAARQKDKQEIIDTLSKKIASVMQSSGSRGGSRRSGRRSEYGYEHIVQPGETLSEIASVYGVNVSVIAQENDITNPNRLRVGEMLFIPE